ncbi:MAG: hypothetical protein D3906_11495 [Candidatus Electrothrix sp. AUS1_2]|nr:hypothetical protein [Candidatus Electrothrix sp. AUS1_2]
MRGYVVVKSLGAMPRFHRQPFFPASKMKEALLDQAFLKEIASQIAQGVVLDWRFCLALLLLSLLSGVVGAFLSKYFGKRAETAATKADFDEILRQVEETTKIAKQVSSKVDHADWVAREWRTLRRVKLEELVQSAISFPNWLSQQASAYSEYGSPTLSSEQESENQKIRAITSPANHVSMISTLYFSELKEQSQALARLSGTSSKMFIKLGREQIRNTQSPPGQESTETWDSFMNDLEQHHRKALDVVSEFKEKAAEIMRDMQTI